MAFLGAPAGTPFRIRDGQDKAEDGADYFDHERIHGHTVDVRKLTVIIVGHDSEENTARRLKRPNNGQERGKTALRAAADEPSFICSYAYNGRGAEVVNDLD